MNPMVWATPALILYGAATAAVVGQLWRRAMLKRRTILITIGAALVFHGLTFVAATYSAHRLNLNLYNSLSLVGFLVVVLLLAGAVLRPLENLGVVLFPVAMITVALQGLFGTHLDTTVDYGWQLQLHVALSVFAFAVLSLASAQAILLAIQDRALRRHRMLGPLETLPALQVMESMLFQLIGLGFALLSLALISGVLFVEDLMAQHLVHKTVLSISAWLVFGTLLWGRWQFGWRGRTAIRLTLWGMVVLLLAYFGSKLVLELILERV